MDAAEPTKDALFTAADQASRGLHWDLAVQLWAKYRARFPADMAGYVRAAQALGSAGRLAEAEDLVSASRPWASTFGPPTATPTSP
jgi:hypothetical protein